LVPAFGRGGTVSLGGDSGGVRLSRGQPGGRASAGDLAYLRGDGGTAVVAYKNMILNGVGDDSVWAGIALVSGWGQVELLAAVQRALRPAEVDIAALAAWLFGHPAAD